MTQDREELKRLAGAAVARPAERTDGFTDWAGVTALEAFVAAANPQTVLSLLSDLEAMQEANGRLRDACSAEDIRRLGVWANPLSEIDRMHVMDAFEAGKYAATKAITEHLAQSLSKEPEA